MCEVGSASTDLGAGGAQSLGTLVLAVHERTDRHVPVA
jgi:hypothetical protein